jgi:O-antigen/teichoic acid export membrane protein
LRALSNLLLQALAAWFHLGVSGAIGAWMGANIGALLLALWFNRDGLRFKLTEVKALLRAALSYGIKSYLANLMTFFNYRLDSFLVNYFLGQGSVGQYTTGVSVAELLWYVPNAVSNALFPKASTLDDATANRVTAQICRLLILLLIPLALLFSLGGSWLIPWFYGEAYRPSVAPFLWLMPGIVGIALNKVLSANLSGRGKPQYAAYTSAATIGVTVALDIILIPRLNITGAAIASTVAYLISAGLSVFWFCRDAAMGWTQVLAPRSSDVLVAWQRGRELVGRWFPKLKGQAR